MVGWIFAIIIAIQLLYAEDAVIYTVTWLVYSINAAFSAVGLRIEALDYLDIWYPYFRSTVQVIAVGIILVAVLHIATSIREQA
jgi:hypothetical protein